MFDKGNRVMTPQGAGEIASKRMAPPTFTEVQAYSVILDHKKKESERPPFPSYNGTTFPASDVEPELK